MIEVLFDERQDDEVPLEIFDYIEKGVITTLHCQNFDRPAQVSVSLVTESEIKDLNKEYRLIDSVTDVLSFPMDDDGKDTAILGDIVLCTKRAKEQAKEYNHSLFREITYLTVHSTLHLLGYDHLDEEEKLIMREAEEEVMKEMDLPR